MAKTFYQKYGVYTNGDGEEILFRAMPGTFASDAWLKSDEAYLDVAGTRFDAMTADDGKIYNIGRTNIRRIKNLSEVARLTQKACRAFLIADKCYDMPAVNYAEAVMLQAINFAVIGVESGMSDKEIIEYYKKAVSTPPKIEPIIIKKNVGTTS